MRQILLIFLPIFALAILIQLGAKVKVYKISCSTQYGPCSSSQEQAFASFRGEPLFSLLDQKVEKTALELPEVESVQVFKHFSGELEVIIGVTKPKVAIRKNNVYLLLDKNGSVVGQASHTSLPKLQAPLSKISEENRHLIPPIELVDLLFRLQKIDQFEFVQDNLLFHTVGVDVIMPTGRDPRIMVGSLQLVLARSTIEGNKIRKIDLRFKNPVISF